MDRRNEAFLTASRNKKDIIVDNNYCKYVMKKPTHSIKFHNPQTFVKEVQFLPKMPQEAIKI